MILHLQLLAIFPTVDRCEASFPIHIMKQRQKWIKIQFKLKMISRQAELYQMQTDIKLLVILEINQTATLKINQAIMAIDKFLLTATRNFLIVITGQAIMIHRVITANLM